jgi:hypothetical protein
MRRIGPSRLEKGYRGAAQPAAALTVEFEVLLRLPANQRVRPDSCLRCRFSAPPRMTSELGSEWASHRLREAVYRYVARLYITHPLYAYASHTSSRTEPATYTAHTERAVPPRSLASPSHFPLPAASPHSSGHPPVHHHGLAQHVHQRAQHHPQLPERRQHPAAVRCPGTVADIRTMGRLRRHCPTCQRVPARRREGERPEGPEHRRYVELIPGHSMAA